MYRRPRLLKTKKSRDREEEKQKLKHTKQSERSGADHPSPKFRVTNGKIRTTRDGPIKTHQQPTPPPHLSRKQQKKRNKENKLGSGVISIAGVSPTVTVILL